MKLVGNLLMTLFLITGCLSAATLYLRPVGEAGASTAAFEADPPHELTSPTGARPRTAEELASLTARYETGEMSAQEYLRQRERLVPLIEPGELSAEAVVSLREANAAPDAIEGRFFHVKSHNALESPYWWAFALSAVGLFAGAMMVRVSTKRALALAASTEATPQTARPAESPEGALDATREIVQSLLADLPSMPTEQRIHAIVDRLGDAQRTHLASFIEARSLLVSRYGLSGYAEIMDRFAGMERMLNRAWSAAADGVLPEANRCIRRLPELIEDTQAKLRG